MAIGMAHRRHSPVARSIASAATTSVITPTAVPASSEAPSGTSLIRRMAIGMADSEIIMNATPATIGVISRRNCASPAARASCSNDEVTAKLAASAGPPASTARMHGTMKGMPEPHSRRYPGPRRDAWSAVRTPATINAPTTAHSA